MNIAVITSAADTISCKPGESREHVFTVTNVSGASLRMGFKIIVDDPAKGEWLTIDGAVEREFLDKAADQVTVCVQVPEGTPEKQYTFRLLAYSTEEPGERFTKGEAVAFKVLPGTVIEDENAEKKSKWWILLVILAVLLIGGAVLWWWLTKDVEVEVPVLEGQPRDVAESTIQNAGLRVGVVTTQDDKTASPDTVLKQLPSAGERVKKDTQISLWVAVRQPVDPDAEKLPICKRYAQLAIDQNMENQKRSCDFTGNRWLSNYDVHFSWCMQGENFKNRAPAETQARKDLLAKQCKPKPVIDPKKQAACKNYATTAVAQNKENIKRSCGFSGNRWQSNYDAHYAWCMHGDNSAKYAPRESKARTTDLANNCVITIYEHSSYRGKSKKFYPGNYNLDQLGIGNDVLSSIRVPKGMAVRVYEHSSFRGANQEFVSDTTFVGKPWNDRVSSLKVYNLKKQAGLKLLQKNVDRLKAFQ